MMSLTEYIHFSSRCSHRSWLFIACMENTHVIYLVSEIVDSLWCASSIYIHYSTRDEHLTPNKHKTSRKHRSSIHQHSHTLTHSLNHSLNNKKCNSMLKHYNNQFIKLVPHMLHTYIHTHTSKRQGRRTQSTCVPNTSLPHLPIYKHTHTYI